jgi:hypothetical protein
MGNCNRAYPDRGGVLELDTQILDLPPEHVKNILEQAA